MPTVLEVLQDMFSRTRGFWAWSSWDLGMGKRSKHGNETSMGAAVLCGVTRRKTLLAAREERRQGGCLGRSDKHATSGQPLDDV